MPKSPQRARLGRRGVLVALGLSLGGVIALCRLVRAAGGRAVLDALVAAGWGIPLVLAAPAVGLFLHALAWRLLLPPRMRPSVRDTYRTFIAAQAGNELGFGVLGETLKVTAFPSEQRAVALSVVALDNVASAIALVSFFAVLGTIAAVPSASTGRSPLVGALAVVGVLTVTLFVTSTAARSRGARVLESCRDVVRERPLHVAAAAALHLLGKLWIVAEMGIATHWLGSASFHGAAVLGLAGAIGAAVGSPVPAQIGVAEAALVAAASGAGIATSVAVAIGLLRRIRSSLWIVLGGLFAMTLVNPNAARCAAAAAAPIE